MSQPNRFPRTATVRTAVGRARERATGTLSGLAIAAAISAALGSYAGHALAAIALALAAIAIAFACFVGWEALPSTMSRDRGYLIAARPWPAPERGIMITAPDRSPFGARPICLVRTAGRCVVQLDSRPIVLQAQVGLIDAAGTYEVRWYLPRDGRPGIELARGTVGLPH